MSVQTPVLSPDAAPDARRSAWPAALGVLALALACLGVAFRGTFQSIVLTWAGSVTYHHGFMVVPVVAWLIWRRRMALAALEPDSAFAACALLVVLTGLWLLAHLASVQVMEQVAAVAMIPALIWSILGTRVSSVAAFPLCYLMFAVPMGDALVPVLQDITVSFVVKGLQWTGYPVEWHGRLISIPSGDWEVVEACSGIRYLIASTTLGALYAYLAFRSPWRRLIFIVMAFALPIVGNGIRAYGIVLLADLSNYRLALGVDHLLYGWLFLGFLMLLLFWVGSFFRDGEDLPTEVAPASPPAVGRGRFLLAGAVSLASILLIGPLSAAWLERQIQRTPDFAVTVPAGEGGWTGPGTAPDLLHSRFVGAASRGCGLYQKDDRTVVLCLVHYATRDTDAELISSANAVYDKVLWQRLGGSRAKVMLGRSTLTVDETALSSDQDSILLWQWYDIHGRATVSDMLGKLYDLQGLLAREASGSNSILLATSLTSEQQTRATLADFVTAMDGSIHRALSAHPR